jgi:NodT family efflux transporter outer membrane factor (OMF) lipoprotein
MNLPPGLNHDRMLSSALLAARKDFRPSFGLGGRLQGLFALGFLLVLCGCNFAPKYQRPQAETPAAFKELTATNTYTNATWKVAQPSDSVIRGKWWEIFNDPQLNALEEQVAVSNQNVAAAFANFLSARAIVRESRAQLYPTLALNPSVTRSRQPILTGRNPTTAGISVPAANTITEYIVPLDASWQPDLWGRIRNTIHANGFEEQATAADLENTRLTSQAELASDYFQLRAQDALRQLYSDTVKAFQESYDLTKIRYQTGIASDQDVAQAETQLVSAEANATNLEILRAQLEHAIAVLLGRAPASLTIPVEPHEASPPTTPSALPSQLLERRPDIAAAERRVAEANAQIGVARAAYFPNVTLSASAGFESLAANNLFNWSSHTWALGAAAAQTIFEGGARSAAVEQSKAAHEAAVAHYRQTVLTAFQQVEDNLASLRILTQQVQQQDTAVKSAERYLSLATDRYKLGIDSYLNVIVAQTALLGNRQTLVNLRTQLMTASVQLIEALGGGWDASQLPSKT